MSTPPPLPRKDGKNQVFQVCWVFTEVTVDRHDTDVLTIAANMGGSVQMNLYGRHQERNINNSQCGVLN